VVLAIDLLVAALFATSLHFIMGPAGMHSFGHAAYFGLAAYGAALLVRRAGGPDGAGRGGGAAGRRRLCGAVRLVRVRLSGVYLAMLTLAFAQIAWAIVYQWDAVTGGSNGVTGVWPADWLTDKRAYYAFTLVLVAGIALLRRVLFSPFGWAMRAGRDSPLRADAIGIDVKRVQWVAFVLAGTLAGGLAGGLFAFSKGSISPEGLHVGKSIDGLVMVLLGGVQTLAGPVVGAVSFTWLHDTVARNTEYWRAMLGGIVLALVLLFPQGIAGQAQRWMSRLPERWR
jgi:branched-chain amino acid transport system permease protein